jgi:hypothetical protein
VTAHDRDDSSGTCSARLEVVEASWADWAKKAEWADMAS